MTVTAVEQAEVVARAGWRAVRRSALWWGLGVLFFGVISVAFWPSLEGSEALKQMEDMPGGLLEAFGAQGIATPAGYLDGQMFALFLPLLLSGMAIAAVTAVTSGDEDAGRLELLHALPVGRPLVWTARFAAVAVAVTAVATAAALSIVALRGPFSLEEVSPGAIVGATVGAVVLALFHAATAYTLGAAGQTRGRAIGIAVAVLTAGYVTAFVMPISDSLAGARWASPWFWAFGVQPVSDGIVAWRAFVVVVVSAALVLAGNAALTRRDIRGV